MPAYRRLIAFYIKCSLKMRLLFAIAAGGALYMLLQAVLINPQRHEVQRLDAMALSHVDEQVKVRAEIAVLQADGTLGQSRVNQLRAERDGLREKIAAAGRVVQLDGGVGAGSLNRMVAEQLKSNPQLKLVGMKTLSVEKFVLAQPRATSAPAGDSAGKAEIRRAERASEETPARVLYAHGIEVSVQGRYADLQGFLESMQKAPVQLFWRNVQLTASAYPESVLRLVVYSMSDQPSVPL